MYVCMYGKRLFVLVQVNVALGGIQLFNGNTFDGCSVPFTPVFSLKWISLWVTSHAPLK